VSQTNPHIVPLVNFKSLFPQWWASFMEAELKHRCVGARRLWVGWGLRCGFFPSLT